MKKISKCCICGENIEVLYTLPFRYLLGLADEYKEKIGYCEKCGFLFNANPFSEEQLEERYKMFSKAEFDSEAMLTTEKIDYQKRTKRQHEFIFRNIDTVESVFEVGAATGYNLGKLKEKGIKPFGIEPSSLNKQIALDNYGVELYDDTWQNFKRKNKNCQKHDLIYLSHVLEHIVNPYSFLEEMKEINSKFIFIEVPTFDYKFQDEPYGMFGEEHVNYFTYESICNMMNRLGYRHMDAQIEFSFDSGFPAGFPSIVTLWEKCRDNEEIRAIKPIMSTRTLFDLYMKQSEILENLNREKIDGISPNAKIAVWGTGHHTSRLLATTSLGGDGKNIVKFYDSDERKHVYKIMNREITKFDRNDIEEGRVDTILISSYVAQASISRMLASSGISVNVIRLYAQ